jgi:hypothetical protein
MKKYQVRKRQHSLGISAVVGDSQTTIRHSWKQISSNRGKSSTKRKVIGEIIGYIQMIVEETF